MHFIENVAKTPEGSLPSKTGSIFGSTKDLYGWTTYCLYSVKRYWDTQETFIIHRLKGTESSKDRKCITALPKIREKCFRVSVQKKLETYELKTYWEKSITLILIWQQLWAQEQRQTLKRCRVILAWARCCIILQLILTWKFRGKVLFLDFLWI